MSCDLVCMRYISEVVVWQQRTKRIPTQSSEPEYELVTNRQASQQLLKWLGA